MRRARHLSHCAIALFGLCIGAMLGSDGGSVDAHHTSGWFDGNKWANDPPIMVGWLEPELSFPAAELTNTLNRVVAAASTWSAVAGSTWDPYYWGQSSYYQWSGSVCASSPAGYITMMSWDIASIAQTNKANCSGNLTVVIRHDTTPVWYNDASAASLPAGQRDFQSSATHELGHAGGFHNVHFSGSAACPGGSAQSTMCESSSANFHWRTLTSHDISVFAYEY